MMYPGGPCCEEIYRQLRYTLVERGATTLRGSLVQISPDHKAGGALDRCCLLILCHLDQSRRLLVAPFMKPLALTCANVF